jgi:hypothetical protein
MTTKYDNKQWKRCARTGGVTLALMAATGKGQGNGGTALPCRGCWVMNRVGNGTMKMSIGAEANAVFGVELATADLGAQPLWIPISDVSQLYFYGTAGKIVDIIYLLG